jgi:GNAT superfamily N-acetyltransferase
MIEIRELNRADLLEYVQSEDFANQRDIPISIHRAVSHVNNPRADDDDILLLLAFENDRMVGYRGVIPDWFYINESAPEKVGWLSCLWVSPDMRGKGIGVQMLHRASNLYADKILLTEFVPHLKSLYVGSGKISSTPIVKQGLRLYIQSDLATILPPKHPFFRRSSWLLKGMDSVFNLIFDARLKLLKPTNPSARFEYIDNIDEESNQFLKRFQKGELSKRSAEEINWILNYPWILSAPQKSALDRKYYFSSTAKSFRYVGLQLRNASNDITALMIFSIRDGVLKLPYIYHDDCLGDVIKVINQHIVKWRIKTFTTYHRELADQLRKVKSPAVFKKEVERPYLVSFELEEMLSSSDFILQDGDGDCAFT